MLFYSFIVMLLLDLLQPLGVCIATIKIKALDTALKTISLSSGMERFSDPGRWGTRILLGGSKEGGTCGGREYHLKG